MSWHHRFLSLPIPAWIMLCGCVQPPPLADFRETVPQSTWLEPPEVVQLQDRVVRPAGRVQGEHPVDIRASLSHTAYTSSLPGTLFLKIDLEARSDVAMEHRRPLNLALVIDRSASMADGHKFDYALEAAWLVVDNLTERDVVSIVAFNESAIVLSPAGHAVNRSFLGHRLGEIVPDGATNLCEVLLVAFSQV